MSIQTDDFDMSAVPPQRVMSAQPASPREEAIERALRPKLFDDYVGQTKVRDQLEIFIGAAKKRGEAGWADITRWGGRADMSKSSVWMLMGSAIQ